MNKTALIYNLTSGKKRYLREADVCRAAAVLRSSGVETVLMPTRGPAMAGELARQAASEGCDTAIACGGDGTVHEVLQGIVGTQIALGVIPMGTGNVLAHDLGIPSQPERAARVLFGSERRRVSVGKVEYAEPGGGRNVRYFMSAGGAGPDAELMYRLTRGFRRNLGMWAYYSEGMRLFLTHHYPEFEVGIGDRRERVSELLAVRISDFGSAVKSLAPGSDISRNDFRLVLVKTQRRWPYFVYAMGVILRRSWVPREIELLHASEVECGASTSHRIYVEADGEVLGTLPARFSVVPDACLLLMPSKAVPSTAGQSD